MGTPPARGESADGLAERIHSVKPTALSPGQGDEHEVRRGCIKEVIEKESLLLIQQFSCNPTYILNHRFMMNEYIFVLKTQSTYSMRLQQPFFALKIIFPTLYRIVMRPIQFYT